MTTTAPETNYLEVVLPNRRGQNAPGMEWDANEAARPVATSGVETMFSVRKSPWHEIGAVIPEAIKSSDVKTVLETAGMDWTVSKRAVRVANLDGTAYDVDTDEVFAMVRDDTGKVLGAVKGAYQPFQNADALDLVNDLLLSGDVTIETAGVLFGGKKVWVLANIPRDLTVLGDVHVPFLCISTTHDGSGSIRADLTVMRAECQNSLRWVPAMPQVIDALRAAGIANPKPSWVHRHSSNVKTKAADARRILGFAQEFLTAYETEIVALMDRIVPASEFDAMVSDFLPIDHDATDRQARNVTEKRDRVRALYESDTDGGKFKGTGWGAFQAFSSYDLWGADLREGEASRPARQLVRLLDGTIEKRSTAIRNRLLG